LQSISIIITLLYLYVINLYPIYSKNEKDIISYFLLFFVGFFILATLLKSSIGYSMYNRGLFTRFSAVFMILFGLFFLSTLLGFNAAEDLIQEKGKLFEIQLSMKDKMENQLQNKTFIFVMQYNNNYYVMEKNQTTFKTPIIYIIPIEQIEYAKVYRVEK